MSRRRLSMKSSKRIFRKAARVHKRNVHVNTRRGGIRM